MRNLPKIESQKCGVSEMRPARVKFLDNSSILTNPKYPNNCALRKCLLKCRVRQFRPAGLQVERRRFHKPEKFQKLFQILYIIAIRLIFQTVQNVYSYACSGNYTEHPGLPTWQRTHQKASYTDRPYKKKEDEGWEKRLK